MSQVSRAKPPIRYATTPDGVKLAYQVFGSGPVDVVWMPGGWGHLELRWELPAWAHILNRLGSFARVIAFDKRGMGLSDREVNVPTIDNQLDDVLTVMNAAESERPVLVGSLDTGALGCLIAASNPERVGALVIYHLAANMTDAAMKSGDFRQDFDAIIAYAETSWGSPGILEVMAPSVANDPAFCEWWARNARAAATPSTVRAWAAVWRRIDITSMLPTVQVPTLVLHRTGAQVSMDAARTAASLIPEAKFVELPGDDDLLFVGDSDAIVDEIEAFVTGTRPSREPSRLLASMLFTDIVDSTGQASRLGDRAWRERLDRHDTTVRDVIDRHGGRLIKTTGDGALATFDRPARAIQAAAALRDAMRPLGIDVRQGIHIGEVERRDDDIGGVAVHIAARVQALAEPGEVLVTRTMVDLVTGSGLTFVERGEHELRGIDGRWSLFALSG